MGGGGCWPSARCGSKAKAEVKGWYEIAFELKGNDISNVEIHSHGS